MRWRWRSRPRAGSCCVSGLASRSSRRATSCASSPGPFSPTARPAARQGPARQLFEGAIAQAQLTEVGDGILDVGEIRAGGTASPADQRHRRSERQLACELAMLAIGEIDQRRHRAAIVEMNRPNGLLVDTIIVDLAADQIAPYRVVALDRQAMGEATAGAARQQAEDEAGLLRRAAIMLRVDAEGAMPTVQARGPRLGRGKARLPHQRAVAEDPVGLGAVRKRTPHPEEHAAGVRLEGWDRAPCLFPPFETRPCGPLLRVRWWWSSSSGVELTPGEDGSARGGSRVCA